MEKRKEEGLESHGKRAIALAGQRDAAAVDRDAKCTRMCASSPRKKSTTMSFLPTVLLVQNMFADFSILHQVERKKNFEE